MTAKTATAAKAPSEALLLEIASKRFRLGTQETLNSDGLDFHDVAVWSSELVLDDATKIIGCYKALTKIDLKADVSTDPHPMRRALAFAKDIRSSKLIRDEFTAVVDEYLGQDSLIDDDSPLTTFSARSNTSTAPSTPKPAARCWTG